jgi:hypothetical protein
MRCILPVVVSLGVCLASGPLMAQAARTPRSEAVPEKVVMVTRPTFISSIVVTQTDVDTSSDVNEVLSDYQYYLSLAVPVLERSGVQVRLSNDSTIQWHDQRGMHQMSASLDGGIVYLFVLPNGRMKVLRQGVLAVEPILATARELFGLPIPNARRDSIGS